MSDSASTDSFETFKSDELTEGAIKSLSSNSTTTDEDFRTAREAITSSDATFFTAAQSGDPELSPDSTLKDVNALSYLKLDHFSHSVSGSTVEDGSWQDLEHDTVSAWLGPREDDNDEKQGLILQSVKQHDIRGLRRLGKQEGGFITDALRRMVWPKLAKVDVVETCPRPSPEVMKAQPFYEQVVLDVNRSLKRFPPSVQEAQRLAMQDQLVRLIVRILIKNPDFYYYQGYHDICVTFLLVLGEEGAFHVLNRLSRSHFKVFMEKTMESTSNLLELVPLLIGIEDPELAMFLKQSGVGTIYSLSWVITWFSHVLRNYDTVGRLFDVFMGSHKFLPLYLTAAILLYKRDEIIALDCDMASVHQYLGALLEQEEDSLPLERLLNHAMELMSLHAPESMAKKLDVIKEETRKKEAARRRMIVIRKLFSVRGFVEMATSKYGVASMTVLVVFAASIAQAYWAKNKV